MIASLLLKYITYPILLLSIFITSDSHADLHDHHQRVGSHGMVVFADNQHNLYASHLPLYNKPHDYQIIYQIETSDKPQILRLLAQGMVTLLPTQFDLNKLVNAERFSIDAVYYQGHFERGGTQMSNASILFAKAVLIEPVQANFFAAQAQFYQVPLSETSSLLIHKIQRAPSFDAIAVVSRPVEKKNSDLLMCDKPKTQLHPDITTALKQCGIGSLTYLETQDFR